jgi:hypothetical protein
VTAPPPGVVGPSGRDDRLTDVHGDVVDAILA